MQQKSTITITEASEQKKLFQLMHETLELVTNIKQENIFLIGQTRSGKSTAYNWIIQHTLLIGSGDKVSPVYEINTKTNSSFAQVRYGYKSVTLLPNIYSLSPKVGLIDLPGTRDQRSQVHVMMVSFIYNVFLKSSKKAKFVLVITNEGFTASDSTKIVNLLTMFIKLFQCTKMSKQQLQNLFESVSLLVTSVRVDQGLEQTKQYYLKSLNEKLSLLSQLKFYPKLAEVFPYIQQMLLSILRNRRLEVFPKAKLGAIAQPCGLLQRLSQKYWGTCQLEPIFQFLKFPYAEEFSLLKPKQQENLQIMIYQKIQQFSTFQVLLAKFIDTFLARPISNTYSFNQYKNIYQEINAFYLQYLIQDEKERGHQRDYLEKFIEQQTNHHSTVFILTSILQIFKLSVEISDEIQRFRSTEQKHGQKDEFEYLKGAFVKCIDLLIQAFSIPGKQKHVMQKIKNILCQRFGHFKYISQVQASFKSTFIQSLLQSVQVANRSSFLQYQVVAAFCKNTKTNLKEHPEQDAIQIQHILQYLAFLHDPQEKIAQKLQGFDAFYQLCAILNRMAAQKCKEDKKHQESLAYYLWSLLNLVSLRIHYSIETEYNSENRNAVEQINDQISDILYDLSVQILQINGRNFEQLESLYKKSNLVSYLSTLYQKYSQSDIKSYPQDEIIYIQAYIQVCISQRDYKTAIQLCKRLLKCSSLQKAKKQLIQKQKRQLQSLLRNFEMEVKAELDVAVPADSLLSMVRLANSHVLEKIKQIPQSLQIEAFIRQRLAGQREKEEHKHQFTVQLPEKFTNYDIITYSKYLINKINGRKTIILLGRKAGKSTVSYWLRGEELLRYGNTIDIKNRQTSKYNAISHKPFEHTEVPNIYSLNAEQLLVDAPHVYHKDLQKALIAGNILKEILVHSSQSKFILVLKEQDITNQCSQLIQMLQFYINMFEDFEKNKHLIQSLSVVVTFSDNHQVVKVQQSIKQLCALFKQKQKEETIDQKYHLSKSSRPCSREQIQMLLQYISSKGLITFFDLDNDKYKKRKPMVEQIGWYGNTNCWLFQPLNKFIRANHSSLNPVLEFKQTQHNQMLGQIKRRTELSSKILCIFGGFFRGVIEHHGDKDKLAELEKQPKTSLQELLGKEFAQSMQKLRLEASHIKSFKYAEIKMPKIQSDPLDSLLRLLLTWRIDTLFDGFHRRRPAGYLKVTCRQVYQKYMRGVGPAVSGSINTLQNGWIQVWEILSQLQIIQNQINSLSLLLLSQKEKELYYSYDNCISDLILTQEGLRMTSSIQYQVQLVHLVLKQLKQEMEAVQPPNSLRLESFYLVISILYSQYFYPKILSYGASTAVKLNEIQQWLINNTHNDQHAANVIYQQCLIYTDPVKFALFFGCSSNNNQKTLRLVLENKLAALSQKLATFNPQLAFRICDQLEDSSLKEKVFKILQQRQLLDQSGLEQYYQLLMQNSNLREAFALINSWKGKGKGYLSEEQFETKRMEIEQNDRSRMNTVIKDKTLEQLYQIINEIKPDFSWIQQLRVE